VTALDLHCATANPGKLREFRLAAGEGIRVHPIAPLDCPETGVTFEANARAKALCYERGLAAVGKPLVFADDSGLVVDALGGAPGVRSARFAGPAADDQANNALLLENLRGVEAGRRTARFACTIALAQAGTVLQTFTGSAEGRILEAPRGSNGFGYDPLFYFPELGKAFAELAPEVKWAHSHRGKAFRAMLHWLRANPPGDAA
jgi:XTP/dITP diphosphohydrolase